ncbi:MAG: hypothetical protein AAF561_07390 [Planctomycetota bacterium]
MPQSFKPINTTTILAKLASIKAAATTVLLATPAFAQVSYVPQFTVTGNNFDSNKVSAANVGDIDGDGFDDVALGGAGNAVGLISGATGAVIRNIVGDSLGVEEFGASVAAAGDFDGDGVPDILVGAPNEVFNFDPFDPFEPGFFDVGSAFIVSGANGTTLDTLPNFSFSFEQSAADRLGDAVEQVGDLNGDGVADVLIGAPGSEDPLTGSVGSGVVAVSGSNGSTIYSIDNDNNGGEPDDLFGAALSRIGDVNDDGTPDFIVGIPNEETDFIFSSRDRGRIEVRSGATGTELFGVNGLAAGDEFGSSLTSLGDVNGDGIDDFAVGSPESDSGGSRAGSVGIYSGADGALIRTIDGILASGLFGSSLDTIGDIDGDGLPDLLVGAPAAVSSIGPGSIFVISSATGEVIFESVGSTLSGRSGLGAAVASLGDLNGDGFDDFIGNSSGFNLYATIFFSDVVPLLPGDANGDGVVNLADFGILRSEFGQTGDMLLADFNADMVVNLADFGILRANFGASSDSDSFALMDAWAATVPEPAISSLLAITGIGLLRRRRI